MLSSLLPRPIASSRLNTYYPARGISTGVTSRRADGSCSLPLEGTQAKDGANFSLGKVPTRKDVLKDVLAGLLAQPIYVKAGGWLRRKVADCTDSVPLTQTVNQGLEESPDGFMPGIGAVGGASWRPPCWSRWPGVPEPAQAGLSAGPLAPATGQWPDSVHPRPGQKQKHAAL
jgi:hypothetical protein